MPAITAINWSLLAFAPVFIGHICLVSPSKTQTIVRSQSSNDKKSGTKKETVVTEKLDYEVAKNAALAYLASIIVKVTAQAIIMPLFMTGDSEVRDVDAKLEIDWIYHLFRAMLNLFDIFAFWIVLAKAFYKSDGDASYH